MILLRNKKVDDDIKNNNKTLMGEWGGIFRT
jgi:hypothetical protein